MEFFDFGVLLLALFLVVGVFHLDVDSIAEVRVVVKEFFVATLQDINFGIEQLGVELQVQASVQVPHGPVQLGASLLTELAVEDQGCSRQHDLLDPAFV